MLTSRLNDESDNPFRPEGNLAKEADQFVKELNTKKEREINEIIKNTSLNTSASLSVTELQQPNEVEIKKNANESSPVKSKSDVVSLPEPRTPEKKVQAEVKPVEEVKIDNKPENEEKKKKKVKSKCGCLIS
ncbi:unnamed protein product [Brachionus calyciflorus]|uniref:Uncharacterized protein n=1 Tax=Brachionus calyciflorus TaxID=104777 RepID=A0A814JH09_9BILA|nr:unnamed protein product [Brachionus calyciflorus]